MVGWARWEGGATTRCRPAPGPGPAPTTAAASCSEGGCGTSVAVVDHSSLSGGPAHPPPPAVATTTAAANGTSRAGGRGASTNGDLGRTRINGVGVKMPPRPGEVDDESIGESASDAGAGDTVCGLGSRASPAWAQRLATKQMFLAVFCVTSVLQGMFYTYYVSVLTTVERLFQLQSKTTGIIMSATEMGQIGGALLLAYYGGQGHRPKWIGWGMVLFAACAFLCSVPHFLYGRALLRQHLQTTPSEDSPLAQANLCRPPLPTGSPNTTSLTSLLSDTPPLVYNLSSPPLTLNTSSTQSVLSDSEGCNTPEGETHVVLAIFFLSLLGVGIGQTAAYNLGIPYIDDNIANRETPIYFAVTSGVRILGPTLGFVLGSFCTRLYVDPLQHPGIDPTDPRWIGAWWLGLVVVSVALFLTSLAMFAFPRRLPNAPRPPRPTPHRSAPPRSLTDFAQAVWRLVQNRILLLRTASSVLHILPIAGLYTFLPKYLESQFRLPVHNAALVSGIGGILVMGVGIFASGVFIRRAKPSPRAVAGWIALSALIYSMGMLILMFVGCPPEDFVGLEEDHNGGKHFTPVCERTCGKCDTTTFAPVCDQKGRTYFSSCHLGCANATLRTDTNQLVFSECDCLGEGETAVLRLCGMKCNNFVWYVIIFSVFVLIHSTSEVGGMLVTLRCVHPKDKAMALGLISVAIGLLSNVPCPIIYGAVVDSACIQWKRTCRKAGACQLYDSDAFRMFFHGMTGAVMLLAFFVDVCVWYMAKNVSFTEEDEPCGLVVQRQVDTRELCQVPPPLPSPSHSSPSPSCSSPASMLLSAELRPTTSSTTIVTPQEATPMLPANQGDKKSMLPSSSGEASMREVSQEVTPMLPSSEGETSCVRENQTCV